MSCGLERLVLGGFTLGIPWSGTELTNGSLVRRVEGTCDGVMVEVVAANPVYSRGMPAATGRGCVPAGSLEPAERLLVLQDRGTFHAGDVVTVTDCAADLGTLRPVRDGELAAVDEVRAAWERHFGPISRERVPFTDWGFVGLPLDFLSPEAVAREVEAEALDTPERRQLVAIGEGPGYYHFLGTDPPDTDRWGLPSTIAALLDVAAAWREVCGERRCSIGVGDIAWFAPMRPDPLGHKDHWKGDCADIRLFRTDGSRYEARWNQPDDRTGKVAYDPRTTRAFIAVARAAAPVGTVYFDDPKVVRPMRGQPRKKHPDHVHLCFDR